MLVLSRKPGEAIMIGEDVRLVVHRIAGGRVMLGIVAPAEVPVLRAKPRPEDEAISPIGPYS